MNFIAPIKTSFKSFYNGLPSCVGNKGKTLDAVEYIGRKWTSPQQRVAMGATAIFTQPFIDAKNKHVDDDTKRVSVAKTISKIIVGTATGFAIRALCIKGIKSCSNPIKSIPKDAKPIVKKFKTFLTPENMNFKNEDAVAQYRNTMGTIISLFIMLFTNFAIDAPLTNKATNFLIGNTKTNAMLAKFVKSDDKTKKGDNE